MFRMFFVSFIVVFSLYQPLSKLDVVVLTTLLLDLIHASGMTRTQTQSACLYNGSQHDVTANKDYISEKRERWKYSFMTHIQRSPKHSKIPDIF